MSALIPTVNDSLLQRIMIKHQDKDRLGKSSLCPDSTALIATWKKPTKTIMYCVTYTLMPVLSNRPFCWQLLASHKCPVK